MIKKKTFLEWMVAIVVFFLVCSQVIESIVRVAFPTFSIILDLIKWGSIATVFVFHVKEKAGFKCNQMFVLFFSLYSLYVLYYMTIGGVYPLKMLLAVPSSVSGYLFRLLFLIFLILSCKTIAEFLNCKKLLALMVAGCTIPSLFYIKFIGVATLQVYSVESFQSQYMDVLVLAYSNMPVFLVAFFFSHQITTSARINRILQILVCVSVVYIDIVSTKRGPILWTIVVLFVMHWFRNKLNLKYLVFLMFVILIGYLSVDFILDKISESMPLTASRIRDALYHGDTASRLDFSQKNDSGYFLAINQFFSSPVIGSYYRLITNGIFKGCYPHNVFLEIMITMGLLGFLPFMYLIKEIFKKSFRYLRNHMEDKFELLFVLFLAIFFSLFTTGTILLNYGFWTFLCLLSTPYLFYKTMNEK